MMSKRTMTIGGIALAIVIAGIGAVGGFFAASYAGFGDHARGQYTREGHDSHGGHNQHGSREDKSQRQHGDGEQGSHDSDHDKASGDGGHDAHGDQSAEGVHLTAKQSDNLGIKVKPLKAGSAKAVIDRPATVQWAMDHVARVGPRVSAKVQQVKVDLGDQVEQGDVVAVMSSVKLGQVKADFIAAKARLETNQAAYQRQRKLRQQDIASEAALLEAKASYHEAKARVNAARETLRVLGVSEAQIKTIEAGGDEPLSAFRVRSPVSGVVQKRDLVVGDTVSGQDTPIHVVNTHEMWVMVDGYDRDVPLLETGQKLTFQSRSLPEQNFTGKIDWISRDLDKKTRTIRLRAVVKNKDGALKAGMYGTAQVHTTPQGEQVALAPIDAVQQVHGKPVVFVPGHKPNAYKPVHVTLGDESAQWAELVKGIEPGQEIVTDGAFDLKAAFTAQGRSAAHSH
jgi:cobalt-zinc-cadmium efflux system membrane fusion protein